MTKDTARVSTVKRRSAVTKVTGRKRLKLSELSNTEEFYGFSKDDKLREMYRLPIINRIISQNSQNSITEKRDISSSLDFQNESCNSPDKTQITRANDMTRKSDVACQTSPDLHKALLLEVFPGIASYIGSVNQSTITPVTTKQGCSTPSNKMNKFLRANTPKKRVNHNDNRISGVTPDVQGTAAVVEVRDFEDRNTSFMPICNNIASPFNITPTYIPVSSENTLTKSNSLITNGVQHVSEFSKRTIEEIIFSGNNTAVTNVSNKQSTSENVMSGMINNDNNYTPTINKDVSLFNEMISPIPLENGIPVYHKYRGVHTMKSTPVDDNHIEGFRTPITNAHSDMKPVSGTTQSELENLNKIFDNDVLKPGCMSSPDLTKFTEHTEELLCGVGSVSKSNNSSPVKSEKEGSVGSQELFKDDSSIELDEEENPEVTLKQVVNKEIDESEYCAVRIETKMIEENSKPEDEDTIMELFPKKGEEISGKSGLKEMKDEKIFTNLRRKIRFSTSRWNNLKLIGMFENLFNAEYSNKLTTGMTHLIVKTEKGDTTDPTYKYLYAMVHSICIVSVKWLTDSLQKNSILPECEYIPLDSSGAPGPLTSYKLSLQGSTSLSWLNNFCMMFAKPYLFGYSLAEIQGLALRIGATVVNNEEEFDKYEKFHKVVVFADEVPLEDARELGTGLLKKYNAVPVYFFWLVNMIGMYKVRSFYEHVVIDLSYERLLQLKFPPQFISPYN